MWQWVRVRDVSLGILRANFGIPGKGRMGHSGVEYGWWPRLASPKGRPGRGRQRALWGGLPGVRRTAAQLTSSVRRRAVVRFRASFVSGTALLSGQEATLTSGEGALPKTKMCGIMHAGLTGCPAITYLYIIPQVCWQA